MYDKMQEEFEIYAKEEGLFLHLLSDGMYDHDTLIAWKAYQAGRKHIMVCSSAPRQCAASGQADCYRSAVPGSQYCAEHSNRTVRWTPQ